MRPRPRRWRPPRSTSQSEQESALDEIEARELGTAIERAIAQAAPRVSGLHHAAACRGAVVRRNRGHARPAARHGEDLHPSRAARADDAPSDPLMSDTTFLRPCTGFENFSRLLKPTSASAVCPLGDPNLHHRHLRPDEIDLLLDGEDGFGVAPLRAHVESCSSCQASWNGPGIILCSKPCRTLRRPPDFRSGHESGSGIRTVACGCPQ